MPNHLATSGSRRGAAEQTISMVTVVDTATLKPIIASYM